MVVSVQVKLLFDGCGDCIDGCLESLERIRVGSDRRWASWGCRSGRGLKTAGQVCRDDGSFVGDMGDNQIDEEGFAEDRADDGIVFEHERGVQCFEKRVREDSVAGYVVA